MLRVIIAAVALGVASPAFASDTSGNSAKRGDDIPPGQMVCKKSLVFGTLSRFRKTCRTKAEWDEIQKESMSTTREFQRDKSASALNGG